MTIPDYYLLPRTDEFQNEYLPPHEEMLLALTGFSGSAGFLVLEGTRQHGALFVDGRYTVQARQEVDAARFEVVLSSELSPRGWLKERIGAAGTLRLAYDPWYWTEKQLKPWRDEAVIELYPVDTAALWLNRPAAALSEIEPHEERYAGRSSAEKLAAVRDFMAQKGAGALVVSDPASLCWLLNVRGRDVPFTPLVCRYGLITAANEAILMRGELIAALEEFQGTVLFDQDTASVGLVSQAGERGILAENPCLVPKACKNQTEQAGIRAAHQRDGAALTEFLAWLRGEVRQRDVTEFEAGERLTEYRAAQQLYVMPSFPPIVGSGANGAIVHYRAPERGSRVIQPGDVLLIDSGGQYRDGTTDVTRTVWLWDTPAPDAVRRAYTLVLKGHIALAVARFPLGTTGGQLDILARQYLWNDGLDYDHGTGHGVGAFLSVHEAPQSISKRGFSQPLLPGMILSNEPGYYKEGGFGIRLENLVLVRDDVPQPVGAERAMLGFETLTRAAFDDALIDTALLTEAEQQWLEEYNNTIKA